MCLAQIVFLYRSCFDKLSTNGKIGTCQVIGTGSNLPCSRTLHRVFPQYSKYLVKIQPLLPLSFYIIFECSFMQPKTRGKAFPTAVHPFPKRLRKGRAPRRCMHAAP